MSLRLLTDFTGSDESPISESSTWTTYPGWPAGANRTSNQMAGVAGPFSSYRSAPEEVYANGDIEFTLSTFDSASALTFIRFRISGRSGDAPSLTNTDGYAFFIDTTNSVLERQDNGSGTTLASAARSWASGDVVRVRASGNVLTVFKQTGGTGDFTQVITATDSTYKAGRIALGGEDATTRFDNLYAYAPIRFPVVRGVGTSAGNAAAVSPGLPTGTVAGDLLIMAVETNNQAVTVSGWTECPSSPQSDATDSTRLTMFYKIAAGGDATTTSDSGDHQMARIIGIKAGTFDPVTPFNTSAGGTDTTSDTSGSCPTVTTTRDNCLIVATGCTGRDANNTTNFSAWTNANLVDLLERMDDVSAAGLGGGVGMATGILPDKGSSGATTMTYATASRKGLITLAVNPNASPIWTPQPPQGYLSNR